MLNLPPITAHDYGCWNALYGYLSMESVEACMTECGTGDPFRAGRISVDVELLRSQMTIHAVEALMLLSLVQKSHGQSAGIDDGERHLLAYAITQPNSLFVRQSLVAGSKSVPRNSICEKSGFNLTNCVLSDIFVLLLAG